MLIPSWPGYRKVDLEHNVKGVFNLNASMTEFFNELFGPNDWTVSDAENILLPYLPEIFQEILEYQALTDSESVEVLKLKAAIDQQFDNQFVMTSDVDAIKRREKMLGIQADPATESLEFRRKRVMNRYQTKPPFTIRWLQQQLDRLVGAGMTIVSVDVQNFILYVTTNVDDASLFKEIYHTVETIKPANLEYQQNTSVSDVIELEEHISKQDITWNYVLGSWKLGENPFMSLGPEEVIK